MGLLDRKVGRMMAKDRAALRRHYGWGATSLVGGTIAAAAFGALYSGMPAPSALWGVAGWVGIALTGWVQMVRAEFYLAQAGPETLDPSEV